MTLNPTALRAAIPWALIQAGLVTWVQTVTGLIPIFGRLPGDQLQMQRPYAHIDILSVTPAGRDGVGLVVNTPASSGAEVSPVLFGLRRIGMTIDFFSGNVDETNGQPIAQDLADTAVSYAIALHASVSLDSVQQQLKNAGIAIGNLGDVRNLSYLEESVWVSRYQVEFDFLTTLVSSSADAGTYIQEVIGTGTETDKGTSIPFDIKGT